MTKDTPTRILLKLSGEAFCGPAGFGIDTTRLALIAGEIKQAADLGAQLAVVVGGGNIIRGAELADQGDIEQGTADYMGMLGTVMNGMALREKLVSVGVDSRVLSALEIKSVAEPFIKNRAIRHLEKGRVVVLVAGTGNPFFTTDTCAALRATELGCTQLLKATKVDGVYTADPKTNPEATRYESLSFDEALAKGLAVMDVTAFAMCRERNIPIRVFQFDVPGNIARVVSGDSIGTLVTNE
ncbi:MAG: UMP kinase [Leptolyngbya sp. SIO3F4]|nr:UMP kinase [Leptolyngbya sp. SIO3F4]